MAGRIEPPRGQTICPECGANHIGDRTCQDDFHQMLFWENEEPARGTVHHLMVLCYHLQHPSLYSREGLAYARTLLADFVERGVSSQEARRRNQEAVNSGQRDWSITARPGNKGGYEQPVGWGMTAADVVAGGADQYVENVQRWARSINQLLGRLLI